MLSAVIESYVVSSERDFGLVRLLRKSVFGELDKHSATCNG